MNDQPERRPSLLSELRRRKVVRAGVAYAVAGWIVFEVAGEMFPALGLPDWSVTLVLALLLLGFPVALALAWAFDVTPAGIRATPPVRAPAPVPEPSASTPVTEATAAPADRRAVAVLPFINMSGDPENEYFSDGITEDILTHLSRIRGLRVVSRTTAMRYKGTDRALRDIGRELSVGTVLEGSVRRSGGRVRITAQLIDAASDEHLWADSFDRDIEDVFEVQSEVARRIAATLEAELTPADEARLESRPTGNLEAYNLILRARAHMARFTRQEILTALRLFQRAAELDPSYAAAHAGIAEAFGSLAFMAYEPRAESYRQGLEAARRAAELDPSNPDAHAALGMLRMLCEWDWRGAEAALVRALELEPGNANAAAWRAIALFFQERIDDALAQARAGLAADPHAYFLRQAIAQIQIMAGRPEAAIEELEPLLQEDPGYELGRFWLAYAYAAAGRLADAVAAFDTLFRRVEGSIVWEAIAAGVAAAAGDARRLNTTLAAFREREERGERMPHYAFFTLHLSAGDTDAALDRLEAAAAEREAVLVYLRVVPRYRAILGHPRVRRVLRTIWPDDFPEA